MFFCGSVRSAASISWLGGYYGDFHLHCCKNLKNFTWRNLLLLSPLVLLPFLERYCELTIRPMALDKFVVKQAPPTVFYISNFISEAEEEMIIKNVNSVPKPKWTQLSNRRLQNWGGIPHPKGMVAEKIPLWLQTHMNQIGQLGIFAPGKMPNHVLVNEYQPAQGIMPHTDGPLFHPTITTISCGSHTVLDFTKRVRSDAEENDASSTPQEDGFSLFLERRSLVVILDEVYDNYLHSIAEVTRDVLSNKIKNLHLCQSQYENDQELVRGTRISLTIRHVPCTTKVLLRLSK